LWLESGRPFDCQDLTDQLHGTLVAKRNAGTTFTINFDDTGLDEGEE
jgi:two-component sensor histidine kinase